MDDVSDFTNGKMVPAHIFDEILLGPGQDHSFATLITQFLAVNLSGVASAIVNTPSTSPPAELKQCDKDSDSLIEISACISIAFQY